MFAELPDAAWTKREGLRALTNALGAENIRWVGGAIRDSLLGTDVNDVDCATKLLPDDVIERCKDAGIRTVPTGIDHGTVTAILKDGPVEITTLRRDVATDGRRATVAYAKDWQEDAARRDFTINALFAHPDTLEVSDYFGGLADLEARTVRFIGDARQRIREDHLRILRYFRFQARFGAELDNQAEEACAELASTLKGLSRERIAAELTALLTLPNPQPTVARMRKLGVLQEVLPEACPQHIELLSAVINSEKEQIVAPAPMRRMAALLPPIPDVADAVASRLRLSRAQRAHLNAVAERKLEDLSDPRALAYRESIDIAIDRVLLQGGDTAPLKAWTVPQLPMKGGEIVERGISAGPEVAATLRKVEDQWIKEGFPRRDRVLEILNEILSR
ncbi:MAG: CCA tRNA nucleotidyltransferase [Altererythrobacter sp.]|nr:CCA tRNA nucleotidyltransferase [Altererythrobacter sp.]MBT8432752.1 CCA tRNA nucleotidyltransferase [Altererythrobacter sp.]NNE50365.1 CCA tRNA nucleotidyltransferase [Altererythrobacter sp.]NNF95061.1 CCA tRNA nucleotidyltransferase [Altererythrobacter sp.]NNK45442.1 CCA tRNA nucleotidyltransferase [Altererythrobacter sp.]